MSPLLPFLPLCLALVFIYNPCEANPKDSLPKHFMPCGLEVPPIGLGSFDERKKSEQQKVNMWLTGVEAGYRLLDTAYEYENEKNLGLALKQLFKTNKVKRNELFITTKVWNTFHKREEVLKNIRYELRDLGLEYSDLGLLHFPMSLESDPKSDTAEHPHRHYWPHFENGTLRPLMWEKDKGYLEAWRGMEAAQRLGLTRHIGVANFNKHQLQKIMERAVLKPVVLQVECHPLFRNDELTNWARSNNMTVICYSPLRRCSSELMDNSVLQEIADKYQRTVRQVALRWNMQRGNIVIPRSYDKYHQKENMDSLNFEIDDEDMKKINEIPELPKYLSVGGQAYPDIFKPPMKDHPDYPF